MLLSRKASAIILGFCTVFFSVGASAQTVDLQVTGVITPEACIPILGGGGVVDYGVIPAMTLNRTAPTDLGTKSSSLTISCAAPSQVAFKIVDNRKGSRVPSVLAEQGLTGDSGDRANFGLGSAGGANIGGYSINLVAADFSIDGGSAYLLASTSDGRTWLPVPTSRAALDSGTGITEWYSVSSASQSRAPAAFQTMSTLLRIRAAVNRGDLLPLGENIVLDGLATLEMLYL